mgnify:CR=1 FL=1
MDVRQLLLVLANGVVANATWFTVVDAGVDECFSCTQSQYPQSHPYVSSKKTHVYELDSLPQKSHEYP